MVGKSKIAEYDTALTVVSLVFVAFYATGLYKNILEIKKLKNEKS